MGNEIKMRIGLLDHMGYGNLGDAAIQEVVIANIRKRLPNADIVGFSLVPDDTGMRHGIPCYPIQWLQPTADIVGNGAPSRANLKARLKSALKSNSLVRRWAKPLSDSVRAFVRELAFCVRSYHALKNLDVLVISGGGQIGRAHV